MRRLMITCIGFLIVMPVYATWQLANPFQGTPAHENVKPEIGNTSYPEGYLSHPQYFVEIKKGFLKENVIRIARKYHWRVQWTVPTHYRVLLNTEISGSSFSMIMNQLLDNYPLQVTYDDVDRVIAVSESKNI